MAEKLTPATFIGKQGNGIISFGSGQPDLPPPRQVFDCLPTYRDFKYGPVAGMDELREGLAKENPGYSKENFVITNGASEALDLAFRSIGKPGDKILLHTPYYYSYKPMVEFNHMKPLFMTTTEGKIDIDSFEQQVHDAKAVLINSPSNPTGRVQDIKTLKIIEKMTQDLDIPLISDEVYKDLIYERENYKLSGPHVITVNSFSKTFAMCGFRVGYLFSNDQNIVNNVVEIKTHSSMNTNILGQEMAKHALTAPKSFVDEQVKVWKSRRDLIYKRVKELGLEVDKPEGAFYILPKVDDPNSFVMDLYKQHNVITYLGDWFGAPNRVRLSYALDEEKIEEGIDRIRTYLNSQ